MAVAFDEAGKHGASAGIEAIIAPFQLRLLVVLCVHRKEAAVIADQNGLEALNIAFCVDAVTVGVDDKRSRVHGAGEERLPGIAKLGFSGCEGDSLLMLLDAQGVEVSTGSACSAGVPQHSHVLLAMGIDEQEAREALRVSLGHSSTDADVDAFLTAIGPAVERAGAARRVRR